jgi:hypothetical protein
VTCVLDFYISWKSGLHCISLTNLYKSIELIIYPIHRDKTGLSLKGEVSYMNWYLIDKKGNREAKKIFKIIVYMKLIYTFAE